MLSQLDKEQAFDVMVRRFGEVQPLDVINLCEGGLKSCPAIVCGKEGRVLKVLKLSKETTQKIIDSLSVSVEGVELPYSVEEPVEKMVFWNVVRRQP